MTTWKFPDALGGGEYESQAILNTPPGMVAFTFSGSVVYIHKGLLTEPIPAEPEPGAYLIGGVVCVRFPDDNHDPWWAVATPGVGQVWHDWHDAVEALGGPDVTIVRLVPAVEVETELPWEGVSMYQSFIKVGPPDEDREIPVTIDFRTGAGPMDCLLGDDTAEAMAGALLSAARKAREATA
ncbi:MAG: hypothetical protein V4515_12665 [Chloroflexota bacterium]